MSETDPSRRSFLAQLGAGAAAMGLAPAIAGAAEDHGPADLSFQNVRDHFDLPADLVYLNNGSLGPCPKRVMRATYQAWKQLESDPAGQNWGELAKQAEAARERTAAFLGCDKSELSVTRNATESMNLIAQGVNLQPGDHVLTTDQEHGGGLAGWRYRAKHHGIVIDTAPLPLVVDDPRKIVDALAEKIVDRTRVISVSHVSYATGLRLPIEAIAALAKDRGLLLAVDGAQAAGVLDVNLSTLGCDAYAISAHKWMLAPKGTGLLYIRPSAADRIAPMMLQDGSRLYTASSGTRDLPGAIGLGEAVAFLSTLGIGAVQKHALRLRGLLVERLQKINGVTIVGGMREELCAAMVAVSLPKEVNADKIAGRLRAEHGIAVRALSEKAVRGLRISLHVYNTEVDVEKVGDALEKVMG